MDHRPWDHGLSDQIKSKQKSHERSTENKVPDAEVLPGVAEYRACIGFGERRIACRACCVARGSGERRGLPRRSRQRGYGGEPDGDPEGGGRRRR